MAFDLYFAGSQCAEADNLMVKLGCNRLFSQENDRKNISRWQGLKHTRRFRYSGKIFIDSGAFSAHTKGIEIDVDEYIQYVNDIDDDIALFAQVDKIPGRFGEIKTREQICEAPEVSWNNYLYMVSRVKSIHKLVPIFHQGESFDHLVRMLNFTHSDGSHISYIGISPANDKHTNEKEVFISKCFEIIKKSNNPDVKTHAFGMTSLPVLEKYPFTSADSTSWLMTGANGSIMTPFGVIYVSDSGAHSGNHILNMGPHFVNRVESYLKSIGFTLQEVRGDYKARMCANILYLKKWSDNYVYSPVTSTKKYLI